MGKQKFNESAKHWGSRSYCSDSKEPFIIKWIKVVKKDYK
jgi:hypothetical protein